MGDFLHGFFDLVGTPSSRRPTADDLTTPNFPPAAQFAAQKERTKSGYFRLNPSKTEWWEKQKKTRYPEIASLWSGCGGRTRTCDLRVMSTRNALRKCHVRQEKAEFLHETRRPNADGRSCGRQIKGCAVAAETPNPQKVVGNLAETGVWFGRFLRPKCQGKDQQSRKARSKTQNPQTFFGQDNKRRNRPKIRAAEPG